MSLPHSIPFHRNFVRRVIGCTASGVRAMSWKEAQARSPEKTKTPIVPKESNEDPIQKREIRTIIPEGDRTSTSGVRGDAPV